MTTSIETSLAPSRLLGALDRLLSSTDDRITASALMSRLIDAGLGRLPLPGGGDTLTRWRALARIAQHDLSLVKLYEAHTDAQAILAELEIDDENANRSARGQSACEPAEALWAVWAAESTQTRVRIESLDGGRVRLYGTKTWCSGADTVGWGLVTVRLPDGSAAQLVRVHMAQPGIVMRKEVWQAVGMAGAVSPDLDFDGAVAQCVGAPGDYVTRPGFAQGGAGIAACWYGGAVAVAAFLHRAVAQAPNGDGGALRHAALGRVGHALASCAAVLRESASWIDSHPMADASTVALHARLAAERCARDVLEEVGRTLGAAPYCRDHRFARLAADLPIFIRQSHGDRDFQALGTRLSALENPWRL